MLTVHHGEGGRRQGPLKVMVHEVRDRRGRSTYVTAIAGRVICTSQNPIVCSGRELLAAGYDPATTVVFRDGANGSEKVLELAEAAEWGMYGYGTVVPFRKRDSKGGR
jgi:hypothetical protein